MSKIDNEIIKSFQGLDQVKVLEIKQVVKGILYDTLNHASKKVFDSGADRELLIKVYNEMLNEFKKS